MLDYYEVLQVHPRAESEVIRAAYRTLARKYHPDHGGDPTRMIALNDAWDVLGDPALRAAYDASRARAAAAQGEASAAQSGSGLRRAPDKSTSAADQRPPATYSSAAASGFEGVVHAGPPPGHPSGTVLDFGRYAGWSLGEIARRDLDYLEWLQRATFGRRLRAEIDLLLAGHRATSATPRPPTGRGWPGRR